jgi:hypothetical protein
MSNPSLALAFVALFCHLVALALPAIDNYYGEMAAGFDVRGYQCWIGLWLLPFVVPAAVPVWLALAAGNIWVVVLPIITVLRPHTGFGRARWVALPAVVALAVLTLWRDALGLRALHAGYYAWAASLVIACVATWRRRPTC